MIARILASGAIRVEVLSQHVRLVLAYVLGSGAVHARKVGLGQVVGVDQRQRAHPETHELLRDRRAGAAAADNGDRQAREHLLHGATERAHVAVEHRIDRTDGGRLVSGVGQAQPAADLPQPSDRQGVAGCGEVPGERQPSGRLAGEDDRAVALAGSAQAKQVGELLIDASVAGARPRPGAGARVGVKPEGARAYLLSACERRHVSLGGDHELVACTLLIGLLGHEVQLARKQPRRTVGAGPLADEQHTGRLELLLQSVADQLRDLRRKHERRGGHHAAIPAYRASSPPIKARKLSRPSVPDCHCPGVKWRDQRCHWRPRCASLSSVPGIGTASGRLTAGSNHHMSGGTSG